MSSSLLAGAAGRASLVSRRSRSHSSRVSARPTCSLRDTGNVRPHGSGASKQPRWSSAQQAGSNSRRLLCRVARDASGNPSTDQTERSSLVNEQLLLFIFQMELDTQLQRALNLEAFDAAKQIRQRREQLDDAVAQFEETKQGRSGTSTTSSVDVRDTVSEGLLLRSELQRAIEQEDYAEAARLRDQLASLEEGATKLQASIEMEREDMAQPLFEIGMRFVHAIKGYHGVIVGWDRTCCEDDEWRQKAEVYRLARRDQQPFYHVLVDQNRTKWDSAEGMPPVAYVAEELIKTPKEQSWSDVHGSEGVNHPYSYLLFFGQDGEGNMIPVTSLRERYGQERRDVYAPGQPQEEDYDGMGGDEKPGDDDDSGPDGPKSDEPTTK